MIKYIVFWVVTTYVPVPCDHTPIPDPYGRESNYTYGCLVNHVRVVHKNKSKGFESYEAAKVFVDDAKGQWDLSNFEIKKIKDVDLEKEFPW